MPFEPFTFDDSVGRTEAGRARVPEGYYLVECEKLEPTAEDRAADKKDGVWNYVRIVQGPDAAPGLGLGGRLRDFNLVGNKNSFGLGMMLGAYGLPEIAKQLPSVRIDSYTTFVRLVNNLDSRCRGRRAVAFIADQDIQTQSGRPISGIEALYPESDWVNYRGNPPLGGTGGVTAPRTPNGPTGTPSVLEGAADLFDN